MKTLRVLRLGLCRLGAENHRFGGHRVVRARLGEGRVSTPSRPFTTVLVKDSFGSNQRHNNRSQTQPDQPLPSCGAEPVPQPIGNK